MLQDLMLEWDVEEDAAAARECRNEDAPRRPSLPEDAASTRLPKAQIAPPEAVSEKRTCDVHPDGPGVGGD